MRACVCVCTCRVGLGFYICIYEFLQIVDIKLRIWYVETLCCNFATVLHLCIYSML